MDFARHVSGPAAADSLGLAVVGRGPHIVSGRLPVPASTPVGAKCDRSLERSRLSPVNLDTLRPNTEQPADL